MVWPVTADLYYRLTGVVLSTTPLRERPEDIAPLVLKFTDEICKENNFSKGFQANCMALLTSYDWPGNVREIRNVVERHLIKASKEVQVADLEESLKIAQPETLEPETMEEIDLHVDAYKRKRVQKILDESDTKAAAARKLNIPPNLLHYFISKWKLHWE